MRGRAGEPLRKSSQPQQSKTYQNEEIQNRDQSNDWIIVKLHSKLKTLEGKYNDFVNTCSGLMKENKSILDNYFLQDRNSQQISIDRAKFEKDLQYILSAQAGIKEESSESGRNKEDSFAAVSEKLIETQTEIMRIFSGKLHSPEETKEDVLDVFNRMSSNLWGVLFRQKNKEESSEKTSELLKKIVKLEDEKKLLEKQVKDLTNRHRTPEINKILLEKQNLEQKVKEQSLQLEKFNSSAESFEITFDEKYKPQEKLVEVDSMKKLLKETKDKYFNFERQSRGRRVESSDMRVSKHSDSSFVLNKSPKPKEYSPIRNNSQKRSISPAERKIFDLNKETKELKTNIETISKERDVLKAWKANALKSPQSIQPNVQKTIQNLEGDKDNLQRIIKIYQDKQRYLIRGIHSFIICASRMQKYLRKEDALKYSNLYEDEKHKLEIRIKEVESEQSSAKWSTQSSPWTTPTQTPFRSRILSKQDDPSIEELGYSKDINFLQDELVKQMESSQTIQKKLEEDLNKKINDEKNLKQRIEHLEEINKLTADENTELEKENDSLRAQITKIKAEVQNPPVKVDYVKITNSLKLKIDELETTIEGKDKTILFLNSKLDKFAESTKKSYESSKNWAEAQISQFFSELNKHITTLNKKADLQENHLNSLEKLIKEKLNENYQTIEAMNEVSEEREHFQYIMEQNQAYADTTIKEMTETIEILERERDELKIEASESKVAFLELEEKNKKIFQLEKELADLKTIIKDHEKNEKEFKTELQKSHQKESNLEQVKYELIVVQRENKILLDANNDKDKEIMSMQKKLQDQIISTNSTIEEFEFKLRDAKSQYETQTQELENITKNYTSLSKNYQEIQAKAQSLEKKLSGIDKEKELKYAQEIQDLRNENISLNRLFKHKEEKFLKELDDLKKEKETSSSSLRDKESKLSNEVESLKTENLSLLKGFKEKELKLSSEIEQLNNELLLEKEKESIFISEIENLKNEITQLEKIKKEKERKYAKEIEELKKENHSLGINKERETKMAHEIDVLKKEHHLLANTGKDKEIKLIQEIDRLNEENSILRSSKESSDKEWNHLIRTEIAASEALKSEKDELAGILEREKEKYQKLEKTNKEKDEALNKEKEKYKKLEEKNKEKDSSLGFYEESLNKMNEDIVNLKMENERISELNKVMTMVKSGNEKDKEIIEKLEENLDGIQRELKKKIDEVERLKNQMKLKETEIEEINKKNADLGNELERNNEKIEDLQRKNLNDAKLNKSNYEETKILLEKLIKEKEAAYIQKIENLKEIASKLESRLKKLKERFYTSLEQNKTLSSLNETKQLDSDEDSNSILLSKIEALEFTLGETQAWSDSKIKELDEQIDTLLQEKEDLTSQIQEQKNDISRIPALITKIDSLDKANQILQSENKTLKDNSAETSQLRQQINMKNFENDGLKYEKQALNEEKQRLLEEQDKLSKELEELTTISKNELLSANKKIENLHFELTAAKHEIDQEKEKFQVSEEKAKKAYEELKVAIDEKNKINADFVDYKQNGEKSGENEKYAKLCQEKQNELENYIDKVKELENKIESLQNELSDKTNTLMLCDEEIFKLKNDYQNFATEKENLNSKLAEKEQEIAKLNAENESNQAEQKELSKFMEQVLSDSKASKLQYEQTIKELESKQSPKPQILSSTNDKKYEELLQERENKIADLECKINSAEEALGGFFNEDLSQSIINLVAQRTQGIKKPPPRPPVGRFRSKRAGELSPSDQQGEPDDLNVSNSSQNSDKNSESSWASMPAKLSADVQVLQSELNDEKVTVERLQHQNKLLKEHIRDLERQVKISQNFNQGARDGAMSKEQLKSTIISLIKILPPLPNEGEATVRIILTMFELTKEEMAEIERERIERDKKAGKPKGKFMGFFNR